MEIIASLLEKKEGDPPCLSTLGPSPLFLSNLDTSTNQFICRLERLRGSYSTYVNRAELASGDAGIDVRLELFDGRKLE